jgi:DNA-binding LytR/AlgR family response regulator
VLDGISFLKTIQHKPQVIFTTAYKEYALNAFDLAAVDYLLKPFSLDRFIIAVDKAVERLQMTPAAATQSPMDEKTEDHLFIKTDNKIFRLAHKDIIYAEANGNYTKIITTRNTLMPSVTFSGFEEQLPSSGFIRVHRSFIINKSFITHIEGNRVFLNAVEIPIGIHYKEKFLKELGM